MVPGTSRGEIQVQQVASRELGRTMTVNVYLPPGFKRGQQLPVLWLLHGSGMDADQWLHTGHIERYMDYLLAAGAIHPFVIVMPGGERGGHTFHLWSREMAAMLSLVDACFSSARQ